MVFEVSEKIAQEVMSYVSVPDGSRRSDLSSRLRPPPISLKDFKLVAGNKQAVIPFLQWTALATVVSFTHRVSSARAWIPSKVYTKTLAGSMDVISGASGLSAVLFSVKANETKQEKLECAVGRLWSFLLRSSMVTVLRNGMVHLFSGKENETSTNQGTEKVIASTGATASTQDDGALLTGPKEPPLWLSSFGKRTATIAAVNRAVDVLEGKEEYGPTAKKRKLSDSSGEMLYERNGDDSERIEDLKFHALKLMRSNYMTMMNHGRTEVRAHLFTELFFLTERISKFESLCEAKDHGFEIVLEKGSDAENEMVDADKLRGSIWDIPVARTMGARGTKTDQAMTAECLDQVYVANRESIKTLQLRFPSLYATLKYNMSVQKPQYETEEYEEGLTWGAVERVSLHRVATGVLMEIYKAGSHDIVLSSSQHSIKAVHVIAIGLRGLLRRFLGESLSEIEKSALGEVTHEEVRKGETAVTAMMDVKPKKGVRGQSRVETIRAKKFVMSWSEYKKAKAKHEEERRQRLAAASPMHYDDADSDDEDNIFFNTG